MEGTPKNQAPGILNANGEPGSDPATLTSAVPTNPS
jgi:hypothetical protein